METKRGPQQEKGAELAERLAGIETTLAELREQYGSEVFMAFATKIMEAATAGKQVEGLVEIIDRRTNLDTFQKKVLEIMRRKGVFREQPDGVLVLDADKILNFTFGGVNYEDIVYGKKIFSSNRTEIILNAFRGRQAVLNETDEKPQDVFYLPRNSQEAFDIEKIRSSTFLFGFWEIKNWSVFKGGDVRKAVVPGSIGDVSLFEAGLAAVIYHPNFGAGFRDEHGRLLVRQEDGNFKTITGAWVEKNGFGIRLELGKRRMGPAFTSNSSEALRILAPTLLREGLLKETDFASRKPESRTRLEYLLASPRGVFNFERVRYNIGSEFGRKRLRVEKINDSLGLVITLDDSGLGKVAGTMHLFKSGDSRLMLREHAVGKFYEAKKEATAFRRLDRSAFTARQDNEDTATQKERLSRLADLEILLRFDNDLIKSSETSSRTVAVGLQEKRGRYFPKFLRENLAEAESFVKENGADGLEVLIQLSDLPKIASQLIRVFGRFPEERRAEFLTDLLIVSRARQENAEVLKKRLETGDLGERDYRAAMFENDRRLSSLIVSADDLTSAGRKVESTDWENLAEELKRGGLESGFFASIFRKAFKGAEEIDLEQVRGLKFESLKVTEIDPKDKDDMLKIFEDNWREQKPESADFLLGQLREKLASGDSDCRFYLLKKDGELIAFVRFDKTEDVDGRSAVYGKSFNIKKGLRDSALGEAVMINAIGAEAADRTIVIDVFPELRAGTSYVENFGFVITGVEKFPTGVPGETETRLIMKRDDRVGDSYRKNSRRSETKIFDMSVGPDELIKVVRSMTDRGMVGTSYRVDPENPNLRQIVFEPEVSAKELAKAA